MKKRILSLLLALVMVLGMLPIAAFAADVPFSVTADGETAELSYVGDFTDRQYGNRQIPVYLAQVSESAKISVPYESGYRTFDSGYFSEADLVDMTKDTLEPYFTTASNYGLTTENSVAYVELRDSNYNSVYGVLIELLPASDGGDTDSGEAGTTASVTVTVDGTALEVTSLGNQTYSDGYAYDPSMVTAPFFTVKVNEGSDFVIDGSAVGTVNAFHVSSGASLYGAHPYTMTAATLEAYFLMSAEDFNARFTFEHGLNTENKVAFIEARNSGDRVYCLLVELIPASDDSGSDDSETITAPVSVTADDTEVSVTAQGAFADKQYWGASQIPVYYAKVSEAATISITYSEDYLALGSDYFSGLDTSALTGITKTNLEAYFVTASDYSLDTENSVAYIEFATNDGYYTAAFGLLIELEPVPDDSGSDDSETITAPVSVAADDTQVSVTAQGSFADKQYWGASQIPVYYAKVSEAATISITYSEDYLALGSDYFSGLDTSALTGITKTDLEAYFVTASDYSLDTENSVAYIEFATNDGYYTAAFGLLIELEACAQVSYVTFDSASISLAGDIGVNYYVQLSDDIVADEGAYMQFTVADQTQIAPISEAEVSTNTDGDTIYRFSCKVAAKQMTDIITGQMYLSDGTAVGEAKEYSVKAYCDAAIPVYSQYEAYADLVALMEAMLNYGGYAQVQFGYNTDNLANADLDLALPELTADDLAAYAHGAEGEESGISVSSVSLLLESTTTIRFYFTVEEGYSISDYTFYVDGVETAPVQSGENQYYVDKVNVAAKDLDKMATVTVGGLAVNYCGLSYVRQVVLYSSNYSDALMNMVKALYAYNQAANAFFE